MILTLFRRLRGRLRYRRRWALAATQAREDADRATRHHERYVAATVWPVVPATKRRRPF